MEMLAMIYLARFDPRPRTGGDDPKQRAALREGMFRSAPPHGGRHPPPYPDAW